MSEIEILIASPNDAQDLLNIYSYYVENTAITFEYDVPSLQEFQQRIENTLKTYPYLIAKIGDEIVGYTYASSFHARKAYSWCVETSIYVDHHYQKNGIGKKLYDALEKILKMQNITNLNACIAIPAQDNPYVDFNSVDFHHHLGYEQVGKFHQCGYKFHQWFHIVWMEKMIGEHLSCQKDMIPFPKIKDDIKLTD